MKKLLTLLLATVGAIILPLMANAAGPIMGPNGLIPGLTPSNSTGGSMSDLLFGNTANSAGHASNVGAAATSNLTPSGNTTNSSSSSL